MGRGRRKEGASGRSCRRSVPLAFPMIRSTSSAPEGTEATIWFFGVELSQTAVDQQQVPKDRPEDAAPLKCKEGRIHLSAMTDMATIRVEV